MSGKRFEYNQLNWIHVCDHGDSEDVVSGVANAFHINQVGLLAQYTRRARKLFYT